MANGSHLSPDFVGYEVGVGPATAEVGYVGFLDFTGLPVGAGDAAATVGYVGILDFAGLPVGVGEAPVPPTPTPSTFAGGGISYGEFKRRKRKKDDEEILFL